MENKTESTTPGKWGEYVTVEFDEGIAWVTLNRPKQRNAINPGIVWEMNAIMDALEEDDRCKVMVVTGAGESFSAGMDLKEYFRATDKVPPIQRERLFRANAAWQWRRMMYYPKPTISMIRGYCVGGGLGIALGCDLRICADNSRFALPAAKLGLGYGISGIQRFIEIVGPSFTKEFFFTARQFDAEEARMMGLANRVVPLAELEDYVKKYAATIAANAPLTIEGTKFIVGEALKDESKRDLAACAAAVDRCFKSEDYKEGRRAFMEKRKPVFNGN